MNENIFMNLVGIAGALALIFLFIKKFSPFNDSDFIPTAQENSVKLFNFLLKNKEMQKRVLSTLGILILIKILSLIPLPGIDYSAVKAAFARVNSPVTIFSRAQERLLISALSLMPFLSANILILLASAVIPKFSRIYNQDNSRHRIKKYVYGLTLFLALFQGFMISVWLENLEVFKNLIIAPGWGFRIMTMLSLTAFTALLIYLANLINRKGIGNGFALIVISTFLINIPVSISEIKNLYANQGNLFTQIAFIALLTISLIILSYQFTEKEKQLRLINNSNSQETSIPIRISWCGILPLAFVANIMMLPVTIASFSPKGTRGDFLAIWNNPLLNISISLILLIFFVYLSTIIVFDAKRTGRMINKYGFSLKQKPKASVPAHLDMVVSKILIITCLLLAIIYLVPTLIKTLGPTPFIRLISVFINIYITLVFAGMLFDIKSQLNFFYYKQKTFKHKATVAYVAFDEIEATLKQEYLKSKGINALIEPIRFTWGMPIRTLVDEYRIYTSEADTQAAAKLLT